MEADELIEGVEYAPSEGENYDNYQQDSGNQQEDFTRKLSQKVREQAQRLQSLEQYRLLCEARIQDLCPQHPIPIRQEHLGMQIEGYEQSDGQVKELKKVIEARERDLYATMRRCEQLQKDLDIARQRQGPSFMAAPSLPSSIPMGENYSFPSPNNIQGITFEELTEYYSTIYIQFYQILKDKGNLEQSLRAETLSNEEYRTYIEVLKQALEQKLEESGLQNLLMKYSHEAVDIVTELTNLKSEADFHRQEHHKARNQILDMEQQITEFREKFHKLKQERQDLVNGREKVNSDLDRGVQALAMAKQQVQKLENEKITLLEYTDEFFEKEKQLIAEVNALREQNQRLLMERDGTYKEQDSYSMQDKQYKEESYSKQDVLKEFEQVKKEYESQMEYLQENEQKYLDEIQQYKQQEEEFLQILEENKQQMDEKLEMIEKLQIDLGQAKQQDSKAIQSKDQQLKTLNQRINELEKDANDKQTQIELAQKGIQQIKQAYEQTVTDLESDLNSANDAKIAMDTQLQTLHQNLQILQSTAQETQQDLDKSNQQITQMQAENSSISNELYGFRNSRDNSQQQILELSKRVKELQLQNQYQGDDFNQQKSLQSQQIQLLQEEKERVEQINKDYRNENIKEKQKQMDEVRKLNSIINQQRSENQEMLQKNLEMSSNVVQIQEQLNQTLQDNTQLKQQIQKLKDQNHSLRQAELELESVRYELKAIQDERDNHFQELQQIQQSHHNSQHQLIENSQKQEQSNQQLLMIESELIATQNKMAQLEQDRDDYKRRSELLENHTKQLEQNNQQQERQVREITLERNTYKSEFEQISQDLEGLAEERKQLIEEMQNFKMQEQRDISTLDYHVSVIDRIKKNMNNSIATLQVFASHFSAMTGIKNYSLNFSGGFKELFIRLGEFQLCRDAEGLDDASYQICEFIKASVDEIDSFVQKLTDARSELSMTQQRNQHLEVKLEQLTSGDTGMRERERMLKQELEALREEKRQLFIEKDVLYKREDKLQRELNYIKTEHRNLAMEYDQMRNQTTQQHVEKDKVMLDFKNQMEGIEGDQLQCRILQERLQNISKEKKQLELFLQRLHTAIPSPELQRIFGDLLKNRADLESAERERYKLDSQLLASEGEMRQLARQAGNDEAAVQVRKQVEHLRENLSNCQTQIQIYQKRQKHLEEELSSAEVSERRRVDLYIDNERQVHQLHDELQAKMKENEQLNFNKSDIQSAYNMLLDENRQKEREIQVLKSELSALQAIKRQQHQQAQAIVMSARPATQSQEKQSNTVRDIQKEKDYQIPENRYKQNIPNSQPSILEQRLGSSKGSEFSFSGQSQSRYRSSEQRSYPSGEYISSTQALQDKLLQAKVQLQGFKREQM